MSSFSQPAVTGKQFFDLLMERKTRNRQRASRVECLMLNPIAAEKIKEAA